MLVEFRVKNFRSFRDEQVLSMAASPDQDLPQNTITNQALGKRRLLRSAVIYGANASGKSNLIQALSFLERLLRNSIERKLGDSTGVEPFQLDESTLNMPSSFEVTFIQAGIRYEYGLSVDATVVHEEWLIAYPKGSPQTWFERTWDVDRKEFDWHFGAQLKGDKKRLVAVTRADVPFLSTGAQFNHEQLSTVHKWFDYIVPLDSDQSESSFGRQSTAELIAKDGAFRRKLGSLLQTADTGIVGVEAIPIPKSWSSVAQSQLAERPAEAYATDSTDTPVSYVVSFQHQSAGRGSSSGRIIFERESRGTQRLFEIGWLLELILQYGLVLVADELDTSLHPSVMRQLIGLFHNPETNPRNAQLIFNTHDTTLLDASLFRRDQIWFVEKDNEGASHLYPLLDYSPRKGEALQKGYLQGRYGAIPFFNNDLSTAWLNKATDNGDQAKPQT